MLTIPTREKYRSPWRFFTRAMGKITEATINSISGLAHGSFQNSKSINPKLSRITGRNLETKILKIKKYKEKLKKLEKNEKIYTCISTN